MTRFSDWLKRTALLALDCAAILGLFAAFQSHASAAVRRKEPESSEAEPVM